MQGIAPLLSSAQQALERGFARLDRAAGEVVAGTTDTDPTTPAGMAGGSDPLFQGILDTFQARLEIGVGASLLRIDSQTSKDLTRLLDDHVDTYA